MKFEEIKVGDFVLYKSSGYILQLILNIKKKNIYEFKTIKTNWYHLDKDQVYLLVLFLKLLIN